VESKEIHELIELISRSSFSRFELERDGFKIKLVKSGAGSIAPAAGPSQGAGAEVPSGPAAPAAAAAGPPEDSAETAGLVELKSPIVGTFYSAAGPGVPNFAEVGSRVKQGQVLCIVEAMKVMNEIESEIDAEVVGVLVSNGQPVEFGEVLFRLRPA
jgi:acetyl-CoA carboxylase biotin carboxyl carrier protein